MVKPLRDIMKKPKWAQSKTADKFAKAQPVNRVRNDRGSEHEKNFTADYVPVYDRSAHNQGYPADNSGEYNQSGPPVSEDAVNEISQRVLLNYRKKANADMRAHGKRAEKFDERGDDKHADKAYDRAFRREQGMDAALSKIRGGTNPWTGKLPKVYAREETEVSEAKNIRHDPMYWKGRLACKKPMKKREKPVYDDSPITPNSVEPVRKGSLRPSKQMIDTWNKRFK